MSLNASLLVIFLFFMASPEARAVQFDADVPQTLRKQVNEDLAFIASLQGTSATALHREVFGDVSGQTYSRWFSRRVSEAGISLCGGDGAVACVLSAWENKMWFSPNFTNFDHPQIARLMVIFHEARHTEASERFWPHVRCPRSFVDENGEEIRSIWTGGALAGEAACDATVRGSYGIATILLKNIAKHCANCTEKVRMDAELYGDDQLQRMISPQDRLRLIQDFE